MVISVPHSATGESDGMATPKHDRHAQELLRLLSFAYTLVAVVAQADHAVFNTSICRASSFLS
jgi:hypothetical protein